MERRVLGTVQPKRAATEHPGGEPERCREPDRHAQGAREQKEQERSAGNV